MIFIVYINVFIFLGPSNKILTQIIQEIKDTGLDVENQRYPFDYVRINIRRQADGMYNFTQCTLIVAIILDVGLKDTYTKPVPAKIILAPTCIQDFLYF